MPATDTLDQQAARAFETQLHDAVARRERPPVELEWFSALPKRVQRSGRLLETAQTEAKPLLEFARAIWTRDRRAAQEHEERLARAKATPRDISCLRAPDPTAWNGLGRRKARCRAFDAVGRAYTTRMRVSEVVPAPRSAGAPRLASRTAPAMCRSTHLPKETTAGVFSLGVSPSPPSSSGMPSRPSTPEIRDALCDAPGLTGLANGPANPAQYGLNTPREPSPPPPSPPPRVIRRPPSPLLPPSPYPMYQDETVIRGHHVDYRVAYLLARGRWEADKSARRMSLREAAEDVLHFEKLQPGVLEFLLSFFFPDGLDDWSWAHPRIIFCGQTRAPGYFCGGEPVVGWLRPGPCLLYLPPLLPGIDRCPPDLSSEATEVHEASPRETHSALGCPAGHPSPGYDGQAVLSGAATLPFAGRREYPDFPLLDSFDSPRCDGYATIRRE
ncbi:hypothetical protein BDV93DRAFT_588395 [Ceratobasidium sp. AG-I]|nr:hypothetical protein BDV93DRAFT_588395 [Ceratobasidium sp. AG-I]